jgi:hypothetical protein
MVQEKVKEETNEMVEQEQKHKDLEFITDGVNEMRSLKKIECREKQIITLLPFNFDKSSFSSRLHLISL